jgi:hypothetical protein
VVRCSLQVLAFESFGLILVSSFQGQLDLVSQPPHSRPLLRKQLPHVAQNLI